MRWLLVTMAALLLLSPAALAQNETGPEADGNQTGNETAPGAGNETGNQTGNGTGADDGTGNETGDGATDGGNATDGADDGNATDGEEPGQADEGAPGEGPSGGGAGLPVPDEPLDAPAQYMIQVYLGEAGTDLVIRPEELTVPSGSQVTFHVINVGAVPHDLSFLKQDFEFDESDLRPREDGGEAVKTPLLDAGEEYFLTVTFPDDYTDSIVYICSVPGHRSAGMEGTLFVGAAAGGEEKAIEDYGVNYLAYWVGIVSFVIIFVVLFATFFLFRYGESKNVVDHRTGAPALTKAAASADVEGAPAHEEEGGFLPDPAWLAILLSVVAIGLWALTEFTSIFG